MIWTKRFLCKVAGFGGGGGVCALTAGELTGWEMCEEPAGMDG